MKRSEHAGKRHLYVNPTATAKRRQLPLIGLFMPLTTELLVKICSNNVQIFTISSDISE